MKTVNRTIQNRSKHTRLAGEHTIPAHHIDSLEVAAFLRSLDGRTETKSQILYSIGVQLITPTKNPAALDFLVEYQEQVVQINEVPSDAFDLLGSTYQYLNSKKENLELGAFYTGKAVARDFVADLTFANGEVIFDPSCGSGTFLFHSDAPAAQIYGVDLDPLAIMIAKFNYFIKFPQAPAPNLFYADFFTWFSANEDKSFDYVIANPPYGASVDAHLPTTHIVSGESFSHFLELGYKLLKRGGTLRYLVPESLLNVKKHADVRLFILDHTNLARIKRYKSKFSGVMSDTYLIELNHAKTRNVSFEGDEPTSVPKALFKSLQHSVFVDLNKKDVAIIKKVEDLKSTDLSDSTFALGVVTGDNSTKLTPKRAAKSEPIYTGKEVQRYVLSPAKNYIVFNRTSLQQVAPDEIYRAPEKLVYKTISKFLKFALDTTGALTTNSANIVIPKVSGLDTLSVMALLNSRLYSYLHLKLFAGVNKVAKENLMALALPALTKAQRTAIAKRVAIAIETKDDSLLQKYINENIFGLTPTEVTYLNTLVPL